MREIFLTGSSLLAAVIAFLAVVNYGVTLLAARAQAAQQFIIYEPLAGARSPHVRYAFPFFSAAFAIALAFAQRPLRGFLAGGYVVAQLFGLALSTGAVLSLRNLKSSECAQGQVRYAAMYQSLQQSAYLFGFAIFAAIVALLSQSIEFLGGVLWLGATSAGYFRRARSLTRQAERS
ncbi:MAG TPA: hypothetical protein VLV78_02285 [Thermoanaerobaculia bacterium]|nr:hypothetical protein [Thermoanaerobaculia bacterium]